MIIIIDNDCVMTMIDNDCIMTMIDYYYYRYYYNFGNDKVLKQMVMIT